MPRCNLTLKQKVQIIELSSQMSTDQLAKKFHVHPSTVTRTIKKKPKIQDYAKKINNSFKTVQTNAHNVEHDNMVLEYMRVKQQADEPITIKEICNKAVDFGKELGRDIKSKRGWWRRFKIRCNIVKSKLSEQSKASTEATKEKTTGANSDSYTFKIRDTSVRVRSSSNKSTN